MTLFLTYYIFSYEKPGLFSVLVQTKRKKKKIEKENRKKIAHSVLLKKKE